MNYFPLPHYSPPNEFFCILHNVFNAEQVKKIIQAAENQAFYAKTRNNGQGGMQQGSVGDGVIDENIRKSQVLFLDPNNPENVWIFEHLASAAARVNYDKFQMDLVGLEAIQFTKYDDQKSHYHTHIDAHQNKAQPLHRKLSMSLMLTGPDEYEGGDFVLFNDGNPEHPTRFRAEAGAIIFFYSILPHAVEPVTKGERMSLVSWVLGPKMA